MTSLSQNRADGETVARESPSPEAATEILQELAGVFSPDFKSHPTRPGHYRANFSDGSLTVEHLPDPEEKYQALLDQLPAVVFMAYLDRGIGEAYVSPQIEQSLGFSQAEWLEDPVRWFRQIHPDDKQRWSIEAAEMFLSGKPLRSAYRVVARDGHVIWFHCEAKMMRRPDGEPWFIHGIAFDITHLKNTEEQLHEQRNFLSAILDTVGALVVVLDLQGRIISFNRACEEMTGYQLKEVEGKCIWELLLPAAEVPQFREWFRQIQPGQHPQTREGFWLTRDGSQRMIAWTTTMLPGAEQSSSYIISSGIDITERKELERTILEISAREQRRIGQDLHDGLGQYLTGIAFMAKVQAEKLAERHAPEAADARKIVGLVNDAILKTRELSRGLLPVVSEAQGLMSALQLLAGEFEDLFKVNCRFQCDNPVLIHDETKASHLYHIAREAVNNAVKHGQARNISIHMEGTGSRGTLTISNDGTPIAEPPPRHTGVGIHIMNYRAGMIGGTLEIRRAGPQGAMVTCLFPLNEKD
jgi:PAS domain S-box-containing protein